MGHLQADATRDVVAKSFERPCAEQAMRKDETLLGDDGGWRGDFQTESLVSSFNLSYPAGWTNATWYETRGCRIQRGACECGDCCGGHVGNLINQRLPDDPILCEESDVFDNWDKAVNPQVCTCGGCP